MKTFSASLAFLAALFFLAAAPLAAAPDAQLAQGLSFCGETVPLNQASVYESVDQELLLLSEARGRVWLTLKRSGRFLPMVESAVRQAGLPEDMKYIPYAVSAFAPDHSSGGKGLWRIGDAAGRAMGLRMDGNVDERLDPVASTQAAVKRLAALKSTYGNWTTAAAAFVIGEPVVSKAASEAGGESDFYKLYIPSGQDQLFTAVLAAKMVFGNPAAYGYRQDGRNWPAWSGKRVSVGQAAEVRALANKYGLDYKSFRDLNPHLIGTSAPAGVSINLP